MAIWKRKKKAKKSKDKQIEEQKGETAEVAEETPPEAETGIESSTTEYQEKHEGGDISETTSPAETTTFGTSLAEDQTGNTSSVSEETVIDESTKLIEFEEFTGGVYLRGKRISSTVKKFFWGMLTIFVLPPFLIFTFSIIVIVFMLTFPLLAIALAASVPVVFATLAIMIIAVPVIFPLLVLFLLITGKGRLLIGSEGRWLGIEMFGKSYSIK